MGTRRERRHIVRLTIPSLLYGLGLEKQEVCLVDLSAEGARVEHLHPVPDRKIWPLVLPSALGGCGSRGRWSGAGWPGTR